MMKLKGFTLAEVLITLAIIGVVAAITLPNLATNIQKASIGPTLAKAVNTLENVNKTILTDNTARQLEQVCTTDYVACIQDYLAGSKITTKQSYKASFLDATSAFSATGFVTNDGVAYYQSAAPSTTALATAPTDYYGRYYTIYIDVDGPGKGLNAVGKDTFLFYVDLNGTIIPYGGQLYKNYTGGDSVLWETACKENSNPTTGDAVKSCAGSIADNGWKAIF